MMTFSKQGLFFISVIWIFALSSCDKSVNEVIPDVFVDFTIDLLDPEFVNLSFIGVSDTIDASTNNWGSKSAGFDGNGIIIFSAPDEYRAYDRTCPYDYAVKSLSIKVRVDVSLAVCPHCSTKYELYSGTPIFGPGKYSLKIYKTNFDSERYVRVWNY